MHATRLGSPPEDRLRHFLKARRVDCVAEIRGSPSGSADFLFFVPSDCVGEKVGRGRTSSRQMNRLQTDIRKRLGLTVAWVILEDRRVIPIEAALLAAISARYPGTVSRVLLTTPDVSPISVWAESSLPQSQRPSEKDLQHIATKVMDAFGFGRPIVSYSDAEQRPTDAAILRSIKKHSPVTAETLASMLQTGARRIPQMRWLQNRLDVLRRNGFIIRELRDTYATYVMTELGLEAVPRGRGRSNSDVERALALGRRSWVF